MLAWRKLLAEPLVLSDHLLKLYAWLERHHQHCFRPQFVAYGDTEAYPDHYPEHNPEPEGLPAGFLEGSGQENGLSFASSGSLLIIWLTKALVGNIEAVAITGRVAG